MGSVDPEFVMFQPKMVALGLILSSFPSYGFRGMEVSLLQSYFEYCFRQVHYCIRPEGCLEQKPSFSYFLKPLCCINIEMILIFCMQINPKKNYIFLHYKIKHFVQNFQYLHSTMPSSWADNWAEGSFKSLMPSIEKVEPSGKILTMSLVNFSRVFSANLTFSVLQ